MDSLNLIQEVKARFKHQESKIYLEEKYQNSLSFANQGGLWTASIELLTFLRTSTTDTVVILDNYNNPVRVEVAELRDAVEQVYEEVMSQWHTEYTELQKNR